MIHDLAIAAAFLPLGLVAGALHFKLLSLQVRALLPGGTGAMLPPLRMVATPAFFMLAALQGAPALAAMLLGFLILRGFAVRNPGGPTR